MIWIYLLKFIHVLLALSLLGTALYCVASVFYKKPNKKANYILLALSLLALLTGSLLVIPKHYSFSTPWIEAAYFLIALFCLNVGLFHLVRHKMWQEYRWLWVGFYLFLTLLLIAIIHDAVTKTTFIF